MSHSRAQYPAFDAATLPAELMRDLRSDHAGESGAVAFYQGILQFTTDPQVRRFAEQHLATELEHLQILENQVPRQWHSRLTKLWQAAGWTLGGVATVGGKRFTFATVVAIERFVMAHYDAQIVQATGPLRDLLAALRHDEETHLVDAASRLGKTDAIATWRNRAWARLVHSGSLLAVSVARWV